MDEITAVALRAKIAETERVMAQNMNITLYGDAAILSRLAQSPYKSFLSLCRETIGHLFLRCANALGAYNDEY